MANVGRILLIIGALLCAPFIAMPFLLWGEWRNRRYVRRLKLSTCADARAGRRPTVVSGRTAPGPCGELTAPLSQEPCVWYLTRFERRGREGGDGRFADSVLWKHGNDVPFGLDDGMARLLVHGTLVDPTDTPGGRFSGFHRAPVEEVVFEYSEKMETGSHMAALLEHGLVTEKQLRRKAGDGFTVREWVVRADEPIVVQARLTRDGVLTPGRHFVSKGSLSDLRAMVIERNSGSGCLFWFFLVGGPGLALLGWLLTGLA
jgi:hypothetical protein